MTATTTDPTLRRAYIAVAIAGAVLAAATGVFWGLSLAASTLVGVLIALVNLWLLARSVQQLLTGEGISWAGVAVLKFTGLLVVTYFLVDSGFVQPLGLALGFGALPFGILVAGTAGTTGRQPLVQNTSPTGNRSSSGNRFSSL